MFSFAMFLVRVSYEDWCALTFKISLFNYDWTVDPLSIDQKKKSLLSSGNIYDMRGKKGFKSVKNGAADNDCPN